MGRALARAQGRVDEPFDHRAPHEGGETPQKSGVFRQELYAVEAYGGGPSFAQAFGRCAKRGLSLKEKKMLSPWNDGVVRFLFDTAFATK
jgi:hypothetical protein